MHGGVMNMKGERQMIYKNVRFKADPFSYDLEFDDRITLVGYDLFVIDLKLRYLVIMYLLTIK